MVNSFLPVLFNSIIANKKSLFWTFLLCAFITGYVQVIQNKSLKNEKAARGIISLETGKNFSADTAIVNSWVNQKNNLPQLAQRNISIDYFFILFYTGLAIIIIVVLQEKDKSSGNLFTRVLIMMAVIAGIMDIIENTGMLLIIHFVLHPANPAFYKPVAIYHIAAWIKFILLGVLTLFYLPWMIFIKRIWVRMNAG